MRRRIIRRLIVAIDPEQNLYGNLTTTDIRDKIIALEKNPANTSVCEIMSENLVSANHDWTLKQC
jgi:signal-transduction protein with cAMP-binding, CBS, and nucleotidyltransferase domain